MAEIVKTSNIKRYSLIVGRLAFKNIQFQEIFSFHSFLSILNKIFILFLSQFCFLLNLSLLLILFLLEKYLWSKLVINSPEPLLQKPSIYLNFPFSYDYSLNIFKSALLKWILNYSFLFHSLSNCIFWLF